MSHQVSIWRAAQLLGVARGVLQQQVRDGTLVLNDGWVSTDVLLRLYPDAKLEESGLLERVSQIRDEAFGKRVRERMLPSQEVLAQRLFAQSQELADVRKHLQRYHELVVALQQGIRQQLNQHPGAASWLALEQQITHGLAKVLATESVDLLEVMDDMLKVMTAEVTVRPSGHQFAVEGRANLLQAGLHAGLKLNYGCGNGSCGMCKVRVIAGEVAKIQHFDYPLSEAEKNQGYTLMCCHTAASSELTLELLETSDPLDIPEQLIASQVRAITRLAPNTLLLHLQTPRSHRLRFLAGQSVQLGWTQVGHEDVSTSYPVASCPCDERNLLFFITRNEADSFAQRLFAGDIKQGATVTVLGPSGEFVLSEGHRPLVFAACDAGFGPVKSLIEHAMSLDAAPSLTLFWLATRSDGHFYSNQCRAWSEALDQFEYELITHPDAALGAWQMAQAMRADLFDIDCDFYLAGPTEFVMTLHDELRASGVAEAQISSLVL
ncbi:2Fe-2S iron-sulfur cluster-binding protein [Rhodoferax sp.]|uniref:2Fe-2S iron-sulfur cluster-binding protein n=1 Tax=Rhodoferax sp. TaxID=50421 RepID=UPI001A013AF8|nr:2Fe-2S iron-sulfur cluster-binding protein [Rhodoferax sp.]MBE0472619.1 2Fe-2S iron-sulfur cluster binding domain-containing protein [Rhodoferax sp.]